MVRAIGQRDYPIISGVNLMIAAFVLLSNILVDLTYGYLDPRVHYK
jgi:ABC-type dipeptide/oligopeptide/nickel transport system permease component